MRTQKIPNKFKKMRFWKEKSVEDTVTLGPTARATLVQLKNHPIIPIPQKSLKVLKPLPNSIKRKHPIKGEKQVKESKQPKR